MNTFIIVKYWQSHAHIARFRLESLSLQRVSCVIFVVQNTNQALPPVFYAYGSLI